MSYEAKNFDHLLGIEGLSEELLNNHFSLYGGYVANANKLIEEMETYRAADTLAMPQFSELKRRFGWEWNGMRLHELYFGNLAKEKTQAEDSTVLERQITKDFGSFEIWKKDFSATGAMRGIGWAMLYFDPAAGKLHNFWINEHDVGHPSGCLPILVMDVFEHAYMLDYGTKKADYIAKFLDLIDWKVARERFDWATKIADVKPKGIDHFGCRC